MLSSNLPCVLILEDDIDWSETMRDALVASGYSVQTVNSLSCAVQRVSRQRYAAIVVDMKIAQQEGERIIEQVRSNPSGFNAFTPILVVSGTLDADLLKRIAHKVQAVLVKPISADQVAEKTRMLITTLLAS